MRYTKLYSYSKESPLKERAKLSVCMLWMHTKERRCGSTYS